MDREHEFVAKHRDALKLARECCEKLKMNAVEARPRGRLYADLVKANKELDGTCRQLFHWRGDDARWLQLGSIYAKASKVAARLMLREKWALFADLAGLYELGLRRVDDLAGRPTGRAGGKLILPGDISPWFEGRAQILQ